MSVQFEIGPYLGPKIEEEKKARTPFGVFLLHLLDRYNTDEETTMHGAVQWTDFPVEAAVRDGMIAVLEKSARDLGVRLRTTSQVEFVAERVDKLINAGLVIQYNSMEAAALDFTKRVVNPIERALVLGWNPGIKISPAAWMDAARGSDTKLRAEIHQGGGRTKGALSALWSLPSALFFAPLMKAARLKGEHISGMVSRDWNSNMFAHKGIQIPIIGDHGYTGRWDENWLDLKHPHTMSGTERIWRHEIEDAEARLTERVVLHRVIRRLPIDLGSLPPEAFDVLVEQAVVVRGPECVGNAWMATQVLLTALEASSGDVLTMEQYVDGVARVADIDDAALREAVMERVASGIRMPAEEREVLSSFIASEIRSVKRFNPQVTANTPQQVFIHLRAGHGFAEQTDDVIMYLKGEHDAHDNLIKGLKGEERARVERQILIEGVPWEMFGWSDFDQIRQAGRLSWQLLLEGIERMDPSVQPQAVLAIMDDDPRADTMAEAIARDLIDVDNELVHAHRELIPHDALVEWIRTITDEDLETSAVVLALCELESDVVRELMYDPRYRDGFHNIVIQHVDQPNNADKLRGLTERHRGTLIKKMGRELWTHYCLMHVVLMREDDFYKRIATKRADHTPSWEELPNWIEATKHRFNADTRSDDEQFDGLYLPIDEMIGVNVAELREILATHSEDDVMRWASAHHSPELAQERLAAFQSLRDRYYRLSDF